MNANRTIALCAKLETKLDTVLFRRMEDEEPQGSTAGAVAKGATAAAGGYYAGSAVKRGLAPLVADRRSGMRATVEGFTGASPYMQNLRAGGSVVGSNPLKAASAVGSTIASDARNLKGFLRARAGGASVGGALKRGLGSGIKAATRGRFGFQSLQSQVIEFAKQMDSDGDADGSPKGEKKASMKKKFIAKRK